MCNKLTRLKIYRKVYFNYTHKIMPLLILHLSNKMDVNNPREWLSILISIVKEWCKVNLDSIFFMKQIIYIQYV